MATIQASDVSFIDILNDVEAATFSNSGVVISVYTISGGGYTSNNNTKRKPGILNYKAAGFYAAKEFYAPDYSNEVTPYKKVDVRTTLHWAPAIVTKGSNATEVSFFTSDVNSTYIITIEGITDSGIPLYQTTQFVVK